MNQIVSTIAAFFLPLAILLVAHFLNSRNKSVPSRKITQYRVSIEGTGYEVDPNTL